MTQAKTSSKVSPPTPDLPTGAETIPGYEFYSWYGLWTPVKASQEIKDRVRSQKPITEGNICLE